jgi:bacterioferritin-associated ferredoxin
MEAFCSSESCSGCADKVVCHCLDVTEAAVVQVITQLGLKSIKEIRKEIGAGDGCTCCHGRLRDYLAKFSCAEVAVG